MTELTRRELATLIRRYHLTGPGTRYLPDGSLERRNVPVAALVALAADYPNADVVFAAGAGMSVAVPVGASVCTFRAGA
jgi:hypothetical protein